MDDFVAAKRFLQERTAYWFEYGLAPGPAYSCALDDLSAKLRDVNPKFYPIEDEL